jgi:hypothetical protein
MGRKTVEDKNVRKLAKVGGGVTYAITLPIDAIRKFGWREGQKIEIEVDEKNETLILRDWK